MIIIVVRPGYEKFWLKYEEICRVSFWSTPWEFKLWDSK
jgi:hypothetical protein